MTAVAERSTERLYTVEGVRRLIAPYIACTAIEYYDVMGHGNHVTTKLESTQHTGSFKFRGGLAKLMEVGGPVVTASAGNFGAGLSYAGKLLDIPTRVVVPAGTSESRFENIHRGNAELLVVEGTFEDALRVARSMDSPTMKYTSAYDDPIVMASHGTDVLEMIEQKPDIDTVFVPAGGTGKVAGTLMALDEIGSSARVVAVQLSGNDSLERSLQTGSVQNASEVSAAVCEGSAVRRMGQRCFDVIARHASRLDIVTVGVADVGLELVLEDRKRQALVADLGAAAFDHFPEPTGMLAAAGARVYAELHPEITDGNWGVVITGSNVDPARELLATEAYHGAYMKNQR